MLAAAALLGVIVVCQLVALVWLTGEQAAAHERAEARHQDHVAWILEQQTAMLKDALQRIQAPEAAVVQHQMQAAAAVPMPQPPEFDNDEEFWESKETLAARLANE